MSFGVLPNIDASFLEEERWGATSLGAVGGVWSVIIALAVAIVVLTATNFSRLPTLRATMDAGANAAVLPIISVASLVGFGAVVASLPAFEAVKAWVLGIEGGPLVSLAVATNILAALTGSASGGLTIALDALGPTYMQTGLDPGLMHRVAVIGAGTLDSLPHNGAVVTLLAVLWIEAPRKLSRYRHDRDCWPNPRARRRYRAGVRVRLVLIDAERLHGGATET
jgi:H+/gluconate symporter-like permease